MQAISGPHTYHLNILLVWPNHPITMLGYSYALYFLGKKAVTPPLGLLTVSGLLPKKWKKKLVDMNIDELEEEDIKWADFVFISAMDIQKYSAKEVIKRCKKLGKKVVAGGPLFTSSYEDFNSVDHFVLNEAEVTLPLFIQDLEEGRPKHIYISEKKADMNNVPIPSWELIDMKKYLQMPLQITRGCPFDCDFCDITALYGRIPRVKNVNKIISELDELYAIGWRGQICIVDDNFIGDKNKVKIEILPNIICWMRDNDCPFSFVTQVSLNLADDEELLESMLEAGFDAVYIGIETPNKESLRESGKVQNLERDMSLSVRTIQKKGLMVMGTFVVGFDADTPSVFNSIAVFIEKSQMILPIIFILSPIRGTKLYNRLLREKRLLRRFPEDALIVGGQNFITKINYNDLTRGYVKMVNKLFDVNNYYRRVESFMEEFYTPKQNTRRIMRLSMSDILTLLKILVFMVIDNNRYIHFKFLTKCLKKSKTHFILGLQHVILGHHSRKINAVYAQNITQISYPVGSVVHDLD